jgi:pyruvate dehydrogenase E2 component (dihydrolipoamide acetyltransferase)
LAAKVIMPALGMAQETGKLISWLKREGEAVAQGTPIMEIETDKVTVEIEAPASGVLSGVRAQAGDVIPVGQTIAWILAPGEEPAAVPDAAAPPPAPEPLARPVEASPVARRMAAEHGIDVAAIKPDGGRIEKADVQAYLAAARPISLAPETQEKVATAGGSAQARVLASPKARRLAAERGIELAALQGSGPSQAVLAADVLAAPLAPPPSPAQVETLGTVWRVMAERMTASWTTAPHFYLTRELVASGLVEMRARIVPVVERRSGVRPTYTDLLVKCAATALRDHPRLNASWTGDGIQVNPDIHIGIATAVDEGLIVPVIHEADTLSLSEIAAQRKELVERASAGRLRPADITGGTFTLTNLGMYRVDVFNAILNPPQAAILAVGRLADRVVAVEAQPAVRPTLIVTLTCDHRVVDGARAAKFLDDFANLIEEPWGLLA